MTAAPTNEALVDALIGLARSNPPGSDDQPKAPEVEARAAVLARMLPEWRPIESAPRDGTLIRVARYMGEPWGWVQGTARWDGSKGIYGWVARGFGGPADGLGLGASTHWAPCNPPLPPAPITGDAP